MIADTELETWRQEWRGQTAALPELKRKVWRQNAWTITAVALLAVCLIASIIAAVKYHSSLLAGFAAGVAFAGITLGAYSWHVQRGAWKPTAQTILAYAELVHRRAVGKVRILRVAMWLLTVTIVATSAAFAWDWRHLHGRDIAIILALGAETLFLRSRERRKQREVGETKKLIEDLTEKI